MTNSYKLSLSSAVFICINIILGAGVFLNTVTLAQFAGSLSPLVYVLVGLLMLPLVVVIARLVRQFPGGTLYTFCREGLGEMGGFIVGWSYFAGKLASSSLMIHFFTSLVGIVFPVIQIVPQLLLDLFILYLFTWLNMMNMKTGNLIQIGFMATKMIPISLIIFGGLWFLHPAVFTTGYTDPLQFALAIPLAIYAFTGFESIASINAHMQSPAKNGPRAIFIAFCAAIGITTFLQTAFYATVPADVLATAAPHAGITVFAQSLFGTLACCSMLIAVLQLAVGFSALGGAYGILFSNHWNLYALANHRTIPFSNVLSSVNNFGIPVWCVAAQAVLCSYYLIFLGSQQVLLQQINALACTIAYFLSTLAYFAVGRKNGRDTLWVIAAFITCMIFFASCINGLIQQGIGALIGFSLLLGFGILMNRLFKK